MFLIILLNVLFASTFIIGKAVLQYSQPLFFIGFRMCIAGIILLIYQVYKKQKISLTKSNLKLFAQLSVFHIFIPYTFEFIGLQYTSAAKTSIIFNLSPFITALLAYFLLKERLTKKNIIGLVIGVLGFLPILLPFAKSDQSFMLIALPEILIIASVISSCYGWLLIQKQSKNGLPFGLLNGIAMTGGGILALIMSFIFEKHNVLPIYNLNFLYLTFLIMIIGNFVCYNLYAWLLKRYTATFLSFAGFLIPLFTAIMQCLIFNTGIGLDFFITTLFVSLGLMIFYQEELKKGIILNNNTHS